MECNRDEALRAKSIAEGKLEKKDYHGARKFALKAQTLYPGLEGIQQMLTTIEVYVSAEKKINGEIDWYELFSVNPSADDDAIKRQYRKLALMLHPDKNKSAGADGAFKLISEAWSLLSDKAKRSAYNQRRGTRGFQQRFPTPNTGPPPPAPAPPPTRVNGFPAPNFGPSAPTPARANGVPAPKAGPSAPAPAPAKANGFKKSTSGKTSVPKKTQSTKAPPAPKPTPPVQRIDTFWTLCHRCKTHYEYLKVYLNRPLLCGTCNEAFMASEMPPPPRYFPRQPKHVHKQDPGMKIPAAAKKSGLVQPDLNSVKSPNFQKVPIPGKSSLDSSVGAKMANVSVGKTDPSVGTKSGNACAGRTDPSGGAKPANGSVGRADHPVGAKPANGGVGRTDHSIGAKPANVSVGGTDHSIAAKPANVTVGKKDNSVWAKLANVGVHRTDPSVGAKAASVIQQAQDKLKRAYMESHASTGWEEFKKRKLDEDCSQFKPNYNTTQGNNNGFGSANVSDPPGSRIYGFSRPYRQPRELTAAEIRKMLMAKAKKEILSVLSDWNTRERKKESRKSTTQGHDRNGNVDQAETGRAKNAAGYASKKEDAASALHMDVPDADFHDFDHDRTENAFGDNDVWSAYDNNDGMPRLYALISKVISRKPFKLRISWLNSRNNPEFSTTMDWAGLGFHKTCGEFRVGKYETYKSINAFSHKVSSSKTPRGSVLIIPQKGDVWALYKNWSADWNEHTPDEVVHKYDMVKVVDDYSEEHGVSVAPLVKVVGFRTVFRPNLDVKAMKRIPKEEMFRFSHQVMYHLLTGEESRDAPIGCLDLDPAATPLELLQVTTVANGTNVNVTKNLDQVESDCIAERFH